MGGRTANAIVDDMLSRMHLSADVHVLNFDIVRETAALIAMSASEYRAASFLDQRILSANTKGGSVPLARLLDVARRDISERPLHFIFHAGHVGSTLTSRLLDEAGGVLSLREPVALRQLAEAHDVLESPASLLDKAAFDALLGTFLRLWGRGFADTRCVVLKATSSAGRLAPLLLARRLQARAIYLNLRAEPYLATLLAGQNSILDLRGHGPERVTRLLRNGVGCEPLHRLSPGELAAAGWLAERLSQAQAVSSAADRVLPVDFDQFLGDITGTLLRIADHLQIPYDAQFAGRISQSPVLTRYAKAPEHAYSPALRSQILADSHVRNAVEIRRGLQWLERAAAANANVADLLDVRSSPTSA